VISQVEFRPDEMIVESKLVELYDIGRIKTRYIAVGVNIIDEKGEDSIMQARLELYNVSEGEYKKVFESTQHKGVINMIHSIDGILIIGEGSKISLYHYIPLKEGLNKIAFIDNKNYITCSKVRTTFLVTGDLLNSLTLFRFGSNDINANIYILGKDTSTYSALATEFLVDDSEDVKIGCVLADTEGLLHVFLVEAESSSNKLTETCNIHLGKKIVELTLFGLNGKSINCYAASDGSIGIIKPVSKDHYNKLHSVCQFIFKNLPFRGGINPKHFFADGFQYMYKKEQGNFIDMEVLSYFMNLPISTQKVISKNVVLSKENIIQSLNEIKNN
jgi:hypothetical protein